MRKLCERTTFEIGMSEPGMKEFFAEKASKVSERTLTSYVKHMGMVRFRSPAPLLELSLEQARELAKELSEQRSVNTVARNLRMFLNFHNRDDLAEVFRIRRKERRIDPSEILSVENVNAMIEACDNLRDQALIVVLWETGSRISEVLSLNLENMRTLSNGKKHFFKIDFINVKNIGQERSCLVIEGTSYLKAWIKSYPFKRTGGSPLLPSFGPLSRGKRLTCDGARLILRKVMDKSGLDRRIYPHLFRHSRTTHLLRTGMPESMIRKQHGWSPKSQMLERYSHLVDQDVDNTLLTLYGEEPLERVEIGGLIQPKEAIPAVPDYIDEELPTVSVKDAAEQAENLRIILKKLGTLETMQEELEEVKRELKEGSASIQ